MRVAGWEAVDPARARRLTAARLEAHWAAQMLEAAARAWVEKEPDWSHASLAWSEERRALVGSAFGGGGARVALAIDGLRLAVVNDGGKGSPRGEEVGAFSLGGLTVDEGLARLEVLARKAAPDLPPVALALADRARPPHALASGGAFTNGDDASFAELSRWFANAARAAEAVRAANDGASAVRCWPHHFDVATLITIDAGEEPEVARSIGFGLSPGDGSYDEPYFYLNPWPPPPAEKLESAPALAGGGHWHREGWVGAVLPGSRLAGAAGEQAIADEQVAQVAAYVASGLIAARSLLGLADD